MSFKTFFFGKKKSYPELSAELEEKQRRVDEIKSELERDHALGVVNRQRWSDLAKAINEMNIAFRACTKALKKQSARNNK